MENYKILGDFLEIYGRLPETKKEYAIFALFQGGKKWEEMNLNKW